MSRTVRRVGSRLRRDANWLNGNALSAVFCLQGTNPDLHRLWVWRKISIADLKSWNDSSQSSRTSCAA
jgi:hypothetical protein